MFSRFRILKLICALIISHSSFAQSNPDVHFTFEPITRDNTLKLFRNVGASTGHEALIRGFIDESAGVHGKGAFLHGNAGFGDYLEIQNSSQIFSSTNFTIAMWLSPDAYHNRVRSYQGLLGFSYERINNPQYGFGGALSSILCGAGFPYIGTYAPGISDKCGSGQSRPAVTGVQIPAPDQFFHYAFKFENGICQTFANGKPHDSWICSTDPFVNTNVNLTFGRGDGAFNGTLPSVYVTGYRGKIDDLRIYKSALSNNEISALAQSNLTTCGDNQCSIYESNFSCPQDCSKSSLITNLGISVNGVSAFQADSTVKFTPNSPAPLTAPQSFPEIGLGQNETRTTQIILRNSQNTSQSVSLSTASADGIQIKLLEQKPVFISRPNWPYHFTGSIFDGLQEITTGIVSVPSQRNAAILLEIKSDAKAIPGLRNVSVSINGEVISIPVRVFGFSLPSTPNFKTAIDSGHLETRVNKNSCVGKSVFDFHGVSTQADKDEVTRAYMKQYANFKIAPYHAHMESNFEFNCETKTFNFDRFDAALDHAINELGISHIFLLRYNGIDQDQGFPICGVKISDSEYRALFAQYFGQLSEHLRAKGFLSSASKTSFSIMLDEPIYTTQATENAEAFLTLIKASLPTSIKIAITLNAFNADKFDRLADIVIATNNPRDVVSGNPEQFADFVSRGGKLWWYETETNRLTSDGEPSDLISIMWRSWRFGIEGFLYWGGLIFDRHCDTRDMFFENPWDKVRTIWGNNATDFFKSPCGSGVCAQKNTEVIPTLRLAAFREGINDFEYLKLFDSKIEEAKSLNLAVTPFEELRQSLQEAIVDHKALRELSPEMIVESRKALRGALDTIHKAIDEELIRRSNTSTNSEITFKGPKLTSSLKIKMRKGKLVYTVGFENFLRVEWYKNRYLLKSWRGLKKKIKQPKRTHSGRYTACAINKEGKTCSNSFTIRIIR